MAARDAAAVLNAITSIVLAIRDVIANGYRVSEKLKGLKQKLMQLGREQEFWEAQIVKFGLGWDRDLLKIFFEAKSKLERERKGLTSTRGWRKLKRAFFPSQMEETILRVVKIFEDVLHELQRRTDIAGELRKRVLLKVPLLAFKEDNRYVRLENTNKEVITALGDLDGPPIVLLHGLSGTGKSSLARDVALQVEKAIAQRDSQRAGPSQPNVPGGMFSPSISTDSSTELSSTGSLMFEQVIFLECGPCVDLQTKQKELRDALDGNPVFPKERDAESDAELESEKKLLTVLAGLLLERPILIILDDVWKSTVDSQGKASKSQFLQEMILPGGKNVKWLVTSQEGDLCSVLNCKWKPILMEHIEPEVARQILALLIGIPDDKIRGATQMFMDRIIQKIDANPLAMTCISSAIDPDRFDDEREWERAMEDLADLLDTKAATPIQSKEYGLSFWGAIKVGFDRLGRQHQNLLILMALCKGPSVPEEIIEYLFVQSKDPQSHQNFSSARRELQGRQFCLISVSKDRLGTGGKRWMLHDMIKQFIRQNLLRKDGKNSLIQILSTQGIMFRFESASESDVVSTLIAYYFDEKFRNEFEQLSSLKVDSHVARKGVIEPISRLLVLPQNDKWTFNLHFSARQVFITYMTDGQLDEESTLNLLESYQYALPMIITLYRFCKSKDYSYVGAEVIPALVTLLENATALAVSKERQVDYDILTGVCLALHWLVRRAKDPDRHNYVTVLEGVSFSKAFIQLAVLLKKITNDDHLRQQQVAGAIADLASSHQHIRLELANSRGLLEALVEASFKDDNRDLQATTVSTLATLARQNERVQLQMIDVPGMLDGQVKALAVNDYELQSVASGVLCQFSRNDHTALKVVECPGALDELANGLSKDATKLHQRSCAEAWAHLALHTDVVRARLLQFIEGMVKKSFNDHNRDLQTTIVNIAYVVRQNDIFKLQMLDVPGLLDILVKALTANDHYELQRKASQVFASLSFHDSAAWKIMECSGALDGLVKALAVNDYELQSVASGVLCQFSRNDHTALKVVECPGALDELANGLSKDATKLHQRSCAEASAHLALHTDVGRARLLQFIEGMVKKSFNDHNRDLQTTIVNIAYVVRQNDIFKLQMLDVPGLLDILVKALTANDHYELQRKASHVFVSLSHHDSAAWKIMECSGALDELANGLSKDATKLHRQSCTEAWMHLALHTDVIRARLLQFIEGKIKKSFNDHNRDLQTTIVNIATVVRQNDIFKLQMLDVPGLLDILVKALTANDHYELQRKASQVFASLSFHDSAAWKIMECSGALDELANGLSKDTTELHRQSCMEAWKHLALRTDVVRARLLQFIEGKIKKSFNDYNRDLQTTIVNIAAVVRQNDIFKLQMLDVPGLLDILVKALTANDHYELQRKASVVFASLSYHDSAAWKIMECSGALDGLVNGLGKDTNKLFQRNCLKALQQLASLGDGIRLKLIQLPKLREELVGSLMSVGASKSSSRLAVEDVLPKLAVGNQHIKSKIHNIPGLLEALIDKVRTDDNDAKARAKVIFVLTTLSPQRGKEIHLSSGAGYLARGKAEAHLGLYKEALEDLDEACRLGGSLYSTFRYRSYVKARLSDYQQALVDANSAIEEKMNSWAFLDRGVLKCKLDDVPGALEDVGKSWHYKFDDAPRSKYTRFKHSGYIKYRLGDKDGARADAESALKCKPPAVDEPEYRTATVAEWLSVEYLNFQLR